MKAIRIALVALMAAALPAAPAVAGWKLAKKSAVTAVARGSLAVTPAEGWNRWSARPIKKSEVWTLDGVALNELYFVSGLIPGETLYRDIAKKDHPLPKMVAGMQLTDIPDFVESSMRVALKTSVFRVTNVEPVRFAGRDGVRFAYEYAVEDSPLIRKGVASGTVAGNQLYLITFTAPGVFYFDRDRSKAEAVMASAKL
jgi:hypothetical protein